MNVHHEGRFHTRRAYRRFDNGRKVDSVIPVSRDSAQEWYALCERQGATFRPWPEVES